jgi:hypothetical protein
MEQHHKAFTDEERKRLAWWIDLSCPLQGGYGNYYREVDGVRWPIHQDVDPSNPLGVERLDDLRPADGRDGISQVSSRAK